MISTMVTINLRRSVPEAVMAVNLLITLAVVVTAVFAGPATQPGVDFSAEVQKVITLTRDLLQTANAGEGAAVTTLEQKATELQTLITAVLSKLPVKVPQDKTEALIRSIAGQTGNLELLLSDNTAGAVLSGRLSASLAFLNTAVKILEEGVADSSEVGPPLTALLFGADAFSTILAAEDVLPPGKQDGQNNADNLRVRRQAFRPFTQRPFSGINFGRGFGIDRDGLRWQNPSGNFKVFARPNIPGFDGGMAGIRWTFG